MNWKFTDATNTVVFRVNEDGSGESCLIEAISDWLAEGNTPDPVDPLPVTIPQIVSRFQGCAALMQAGCLDDVETHMASADPFEQLAWRTITEMRRYSPMTEKIGLLLGLNDAMIDDLFRFAETISA